MTYCFLSFIVYLSTYQEVNMTDYKAMYLTLVRGIREASELLPPAEENRAAAEKLTQALREAEELYLSAK